MYHFSIILYRKRTYILIRITKGSVAGYSVMCVVFFPPLPGLKHRKILNYMLRRIDVWRKVSVRILVHGMPFHLWEFLFVSMSGLENYELCFAVSIYLPEVKSTAAVWSLSLKRNQGVFLYLECDCSPLNELWRAQWKTSQRLWGCLYEKRPACAQNAKVHFIKGTRRCLTELHPKFSPIDVSGVGADEAVLCTCVTAAL